MNKTFVVLGNTFLKKKTRMCHIFQGNDDIAYTIWLFCKDFGGMSSCLPCEMLPILVTYFNLSSCSHIFFSNQAIIIVCVLNMRKQPCISREP